MDKYQPQKKYYNKNKKLILEKMKLYYAANKDRIKSYSKNRYATQKLNKSIL